MRCWRPSRYGRNWFAAGRWLIRTPDLGAWLVHYNTKRPHHGYRETWGKVTPEADTTDFGDIKIMNLPTSRAPMPSAPMKYMPDGKVDWGNMWDTFCELAQEGGHHIGERC